MDKTDIAIWIVAVVIITIVFVTGLIGTSIQEKRTTAVWGEYLQDYQAFTAQGITYDVEDIETFEYKVLYHEDDMLVFTMKNGDVVQTTIGGIIWHK